MNSIAFLDINDSNLQLWHAGKHLRSPGYALLEGGQYRFGQRARDAARLRPRDINTRYWWQLSTEALQPALGPARHTADLVHAHLLELHREAGEPQELLLAASGSMQREQLALLLGIVQQCPFDVVGLVNRSTTIGSLYGGPGRLFHLEIQLHQSLLSQLSQSGQAISLQRSVPLPGCGLLQLQERLVEFAAAAFIRQTRFDPRRKAETEQQLYNALPGALQKLAQAGETNLEINGYQTRINRTELTAAGQRLFDSASAAMGNPTPQDRLLADPLAALLPGLGERFDNLELIATDAVHRALVQHREKLENRGQPLSFISALPCLQSTDSAAETPATIAPMPAPSPAAAPEPTHALLGGRAKPLQTKGTEVAEGVKIYRSPQGWRLQACAGLNVNGSDPQPDQVLLGGDIIHNASGQEIRLIEVESLET